MFFSSPIQRCAYFFEILLNPSIFIIYNSDTHNGLFYLSLFYTEGRGGGHKIFSCLYIYMLNMIRQYICAKI